MMIERSFYLNQLIKSRGNKKIKVLTGVTGSGKTTLLKLYINHLISMGVKTDSIIFVNLEEHMFDNAEQVEKFILQKMVKGKPYHIFIDELFTIPDYLMLLMEYINNNLYDVYVTVSDLNCGSLSSENLFQTIHIHPLSFSEYVSYKKDIDRFQLLEEYLNYGGLAGLISAEQKINDKKELLKLICDNKILYHIIKAHNIYNEEAFLNLAKSFAHQFNNTTPYEYAKNSKDEKNKKLSDKTVKTYTEHLTSSSLLHQSKRYLIKEEKYSKTAARYYFEDVALLNHYADFKLNDRFPKLQNIVFIELKRRGFEVCSGLHSYLKKVKGRPVRYSDNISFVVINQAIKYVIELSENSLNDIENKTGKLLNVKDSFKKILLVDGDIKTFTNDKGVVIMSVTDFLLNENSLDI